MSCFNPATALPTGILISRLEPHGDYIVCDGRCNKAWGIADRPTFLFAPGKREAVNKEPLPWTEAAELADKLDINPDDTVIAPDRALGEAPRIANTTEGAHGKPRSHDEAHNTWCVRACERSRQLPNFAAPVDFVPPRMDFPTPNFSGRCVLCYGGSAAPGSARVPHADGCPRS